MPPPQLAAAVASYGAAIAVKFAVGGGEPEDHLRSPFEQLLADGAALAGLGNVVASGESTPAWNQRSHGGGSRHCSWPTPRASSIPS